MKKIKSLGDRVLALFLSDVGAGACVYEQGCCCGTLRRLNCYGACVPYTKPGTCLTASNPRCR